MGKAETMDESEKNYYDRDYYDQDYYHFHLGEEYERGHGWEEQFGKHADRIVREIHPGRVLDVGCAKGFLVEALRDRGAEAFGIDISEYAIANVREDMRPYCAVQSALLPIRERYDLITCIEVLEHLGSADIPAAIQNMCDATDDILFSSTPFDYEEESHVSIHTPEYWAEQFSYHGFYHDVQYDGSYISIQAMRFRRAKKSSVDLIRDYESELFQKHQELAAARQRYQTSQENVQIYKEAYQKHVDMINEELNPKINALQQTLLEKEKEIVETAKEAAEEAEKRFRFRLEEEVRKRKNLEETYYEKEDVRRQLECCRIELKQAKEQVFLLQQEAAGRENATMTRRQSARKQRLDRRLEKKLLRLDASYWKPVFDQAYYAGHNEDIAQAIGQDEQALLEHFIRYGMREGRRANEAFDIDIYMRCNPDVVHAWKFDKRACYLHYITDGMREGRRAR